MIKVSSQGSVFIRMMLTDCDGVPITADSVASIELTVCEADAPYQPVPGYDKLPIDKSVIMDTPVEAHGFRYNVNFNPWSDTPMFPYRGERYLVEVVFYDTLGRPSAHQVEVEAV